MSNLQDIRTKLIPIQLDRERHLKFDLNAFAELEELFGGINAAFDAMQQGSVKAIRAMLWCGLLHEDKSITIEQVGGMIDMSNINEVIKAISKAIGEAMPAGDDTRKNV